MDAEILRYFVEETSQILNELELAVDRIEETTGSVFPEREVTEFAQKIDRVMGAAKTLEVSSPGWPGVAFISSVTEACKSMGYQAVALKRTALVPVFAGFWAETLEILREVVSVLHDPKAATASVSRHSSRLQSRLAWLAERVAPANEEERQKVIALLRNL